MCFIFVLYTKVSTTQPPLYIIQNYGVMNLFDNDYIKEF